MKFSGKLHMKNLCLKYQFCRYLHEELPLKVSENFKLQHFTKNVWLSAKNCGEISSLQICVQPVL